MKTFPAMAFALAALLFISTLPAQVPQLINYQGRVAVGTVNFDGSGQFKFALVDAAGTTTYESNDGTSVAGSQPANAVTLTVAKGLYSVLLSDATLPNMTIVPATVFTNADVRLRVWFNDGTNGSQLLTPDQRIAAVGYAMIAGNVADGAVSSAHLAPNLTLSGTTTGTFAGSGTTGFQTVADTSQNAAANTNYLLTNAALSTITLPSAPAVGDVVRINGVGAGGWQAMQNAGQSIVGAGSNTGPAGATWTARAFSSAWAGVASSSDSSKLIAAVAGGQLYTSTDSGVTWAPRESKRNWQFVASSTDGTKLVAGVLGGQLYTSIGATIANSLADAAGTTTALQYIGNNQWQALTEANAASASISGSASSFSGPLAGDVLGTQNATVVSTVGASTAANIHAAELAANAATNANTAGIIVKRDGSGNFSAGTITAGGGFSLPTTISSSTGVISLGGTPFLHGFGTQNTFVGSNAGNFNMAGDYNTAVGNDALRNNTQGRFKTASSGYALYNNT